MYLIIIGDSKAELNINIARTILSGQPTNGSCVASGKMYSQNEIHFIRAKLVHNNDNKGDCSINYTGRLQNPSHTHYQQNFNITCNNGNNSVEIQCFTSINNDISQIISIQGICTYVHIYICSYTRTGFEKTKLPHTSNFMTLVNHNL